VTDNGGWVLSARDKSLDVVKLFTKLHSQLSSSLSAWIAMLRSRIQKADLIGFKKLVRSPIQLWSHLWYEECFCCGIQCGQSTGSYPTPNGEGEYWLPKRGQPAILKFNHTK